MKRQIQRLWIISFVLLGLVFAGPIVQNADAAFDSGSTCINILDSKCSGTFSPTVNTVVPLPSDGILDYTTFTVPYGVTVTFTKNAANTPVIIRTTGDVLIEGTINVSAQTAATNSGSFGDGNLGDDGLPGTGGPGGFDGGYGGYSSLFGGATFQPGGSGKGPGGGPIGGNCYGYGCNGSGGGFGTTGGAASGLAGGATYGQASLLPLVGGSGGGGGAAGSSFNGAGGGGGGGAIMIASSTKITVGTTSNSSGGRIYANGGAGGRSSGSGCGGCGGGGSGGAIRLVANTLTNPNSWGYLEAAGGGCYGDCGYSAGCGGAGIIRLEVPSDGTITGWNTGRSNPAYSLALTGHVLVPNSPTLVISSVTPTSGSPVAVPANPTGNADITFPEGTTSATVSLAAENIPIGTTVTVYVVPASGAGRTSALSTALAGASDAATTATATITLSPGNNVLLASATYSVTELIAMNLPTFDDGIRVAKIRVESTMGGETRIIYITASGKEYPADGIKKKV